jgi:hypothetical protein
MKRAITSGLLVALSAALLASCGGGGSGTGSASILVSVSISPTSASVPVATTQQFTANVIGTSNSVVAWQVNGVPNGNSTVGTITAAGLYTAPAAIPSPATVSVTAVSQADSTKSASAAVTVVQFSSGSLDGQYSFLLAGDDVNGFFTGVGSFQADGRGTISSGSEDLNYGLGYLPNLALNGTYTVGPDGRGALTLTNSLGSLEYSLVVISNSRARFVEFNSSANGEGLLLKRDPTAFSTAAIKGGYALGFGGSDAKGEPASIAGMFTADGAGKLTSGAEDANEGGVITSNGAITGTYSVDSNGRGTAAITDASGTKTNFIFHVVTQDTLFFVETDYPFPIVEGTAKRQQAATFSNSSLTGDYAFMFSGITPLGYVATAGRFTSDGAGNLASGVFDENNTGKVSANTAFTGTSSVSSVGRGTASLKSSLGTSPLAFYMVSPQEAFVILEDPNAVASGSMLAQSGGPFDNTSASGSFGFLFFTSDTDTDQAGQTTLLGGRTGGNMTGTEDINDDRTLTADAMLSGTYSISSNGRATAPVTNPNGTANLAFYLVSPSRFFVIQDDASSTTSGNVEKQF